MYVPSANIVYINTLYNQLTVHPRFAEVTKLFCSQLSPGHVPRECGLTDSATHTHVETTFQLHELVLDHGKRAENWNSKLLQLMFPPGAVEKTI